MPASRSDTRLILAAGGAVVLAGALVALLLLFATGQNAQPKKYVPFAAGLARTIKKNLQDGGPYYYPDIFGGHRSILLALEDGNVVALSTLLPGTNDCRLEWKGRINRFVDCHGDEHRSVELDRYEDFIDPAGENKGFLFIDLRHKLPAPRPGTATNPGTATK
jgi:hypothetical protein